MNIHKNEWTTPDFAQMSWHDVHVHGFRLTDENTQRGTSDIIFDIDYILDWIEVAQGYLFAVAQASLRFHQASDLRLSLDYKTPTAGVCAFSLSKIEQRRLIYPTGAQSFEWKLGVNWPMGEIEFAAPGFTQVLVGPIHRQNGQSLATRRRI